jgi:exo-beta-1,3-glucanase (GH17 family)
VKPSSSSNDKPNDKPATNDGSKRFGISYAPYRADHGCKSADDIEDDFRHFAKEYSVVRIYGTDCDQVPKVYRAAKAADVKLMLGIWDIHDVENEASKIVAALDGDWDIVHSITVGNELVNAGQARPQEVVHAVRQAREALRSGGYEGPVASVDTFIATEKHPELCEESDFCAINAHAFFDSTMRAEDAGKWLTNTVEQVQSKLSKPMHVVVTETGWPMNGASNGLAIPGLENQKLALESIMEAFADRPGDVILFSAFNDLWKERTMTTFNADQYWGIGGAISRCDL